MKLQHRIFGDADDVREVPLGRLETYDMGEMRIGRSTLQPGWRWSESIRPIARTELCEYHHIGLCVSGSARIRMREGAELHVEAGQFYEVPPGHDSWVVGDEPWVTIDWYPSTAFARPEGGGFDRVLATLLITDIVDSTARAAELGDGRWRDLLARHDQIVRVQLDRFRGREVTTTGDGFVAVFDGAERAIRAGQQIAGAVSGIGLEARVAVHSGEIELDGANVRGLAIHIATRIMDLAGPGEVYASWATRELLSGSPISFVDRGLHALKGVAEPRRVYLVDPSESYAGDSGVMTTGR
jgi:class 3 adenylate cyclase